jgi:A/G-specific adenine glycosylase
MNTDKLIDWYQNNKRDLPWRNTKNPYLVWLSEIILQQTRVKQGLPYYQKIIDRFPDVFSLASAEEQEVLKLWQGLGYYSRARNLHKAAKQVVEKFNGVFPNNYQNLLQLPGVGQYTAAAIASFCYNEPFAVLDGNVYRVLSRLFGVDIPINSTEGKQIFTQLAQEHLDKKQPAEYNQAVMEFGALHCTPKQPKCDICPLQAECVGYQTGTVSHLPVKLQKIKIKKRFLHFFLVNYKDKIVLVKRENNDIWKNLYQLPVIETKDEHGFSEKDVKKMFKKFGVTTTQKPKKIEKIIHQLTHRQLHIVFWKINSSTKPIHIIDKKRLNKYPLPIVIANFLENYL